jgi:CheY-like chemotaxis protein
MSGTREETQERPLILLIENDDADVFLFRRALSKLDYCGDVRVVGTVSEARSYMENTGSYMDKTYFRRPQLIVSDFRLNGPTALEFVRWLRQDHQETEVPVVVLSGAVRAADLPQITGAGVNELIYKTPDVAALAARLQPILPVLLTTLLASGVLSYAA